MAETESRNNAKCRKFQASKTSFLYTVWFETECMECKNPQYSMKCVINVKHKNIIPIYRMAETESRHNATCCNFQTSKPYYYIQYGLTSSA